MEKDCAVSILEENEYASINDSDFDDDEYIMKKPSGKHNYLFEIFRSS